MNPRPEEQIQKFPLVLGSTRRKSSPLTAYVAPAPGSFKENFLKTDLNSDILGHSGHNLKNTVSKSNSFITLVRVTPGITLKRLANGTSTVKGMLWFFYPIDLSRKSGKG